ncbi:serine/threonine-protein kinase [Acanthopleuribacter pedis]|uniref:Serine/threonine protein kinase n=1 Tax=Acanthopleuribacter pedis TaxID=442870 RepID=A0A8J7Q9D8_9BACT|nr:serine/threonine-protein kinase [Acanthopleuribacter pedis]MBO1319839.1 serine/threonine protein kinase [Acanthopleuribacter pedis]
MDIELWQQAEPIVEAALELPPEEQETYIQQTCGTNAALAEAVRALLTVDLEPMAFIEGKAIEETGPVQGSRLDQYELQEEIGHGGMSVVFRALEHGPDFQREVAVKILKKGMDSEDILLRFKQERHIMATLSHPRIATLINAGTTQDGRPYLVMPFFRGTTLTTYCSEQRLGLHERLNLFLEICRTVAFAHRNLVIHRDLKPGNILVDNHGEPFLLDFGIAKLLQGDQAAEETRTGRQLFTPEYASPEQIAGHPATTATDIYALGVILYQLLVQERPFIRKTPSQAALMAGLGRENAEKPSARLSKRQREGAKNEPALIQAHQLRGDLDTITLQALRPDPDRRYATVVQFADDIEAYLAGYPVSARQESWHYYVAKWLKRNRALGITLAAAALSALGFTLLLARQYNETSNALRHAELETKRAKMFSDFMIDIFSAADPWAGDREQLNAMTVVERAAAQIRDEFHDDPAARASLMHTMGKVYTQANMAEQGVPLLREALTLRHNIVKETPPLKQKNSVLLMADTMFEYGRGLADIGEHDEAEVVFRDILEVYHVYLPEDHTRPGAVLYELAESAFRAGRFEAATENAVNALSYLDQYDDKTVHQRAMVQNLIGEIYHKYSRFEESGRYLNKALEQYRNVLPPDHPTIAITLTALANHYASIGRYSEGIPLVLEAIDILDAKFDAKHSQHISAYAVLGELQAQMGKYVQAEEAVMQAVQIAEKSMGPNHVATAAQYNNLGVLYKQMGHLNRALDMHQRALAIHDRSPKENRMGRAATLFHYADTLLRLERLDLIEALLQEALQIHREQPNTQHKVAAATFKTLGSYYLQTGRLKEAINPLQKAIDIRREVFGPWDHEMARTEVVLADIYLALGDELNARRHAKTGIDILGQPQFGDPPGLYSALLVKRKILKQFGGSARERKPLEDRIRELERNYPGLGSPNP